MLTILINLKKKLRQFSNIVSGNKNIPNNLHKQNTRIDRLSNHSGELNTKRAIYSISPKRATPKFAKFG
jgi:hypothetical protein